jgi:hypothetical protein
MSSNAQDDATQANKDVSAQTLAFQKQIHDEDIARNKPFYDTGVSANANIDKMTHGGYDMQESPAAQYELQQGTRSLNRQLAARGLLGSGNAAQRLSELSSGVAAKDYNDQYSRLLDQVKIGTGASASAGASSNTLSSAVGQNATNQTAANTASGNARAALYSGMGGASSSAAGTALNAYKLYQNSGNGGAAAAPAATEATGAGSYGVLSSDAGYTFAL